MKPAPQALCAKCLRPLKPWEGFAIDATDTGSNARFVLRWHLDCHAADPLAEEFADAEHPRLDERTAARGYLDALGKLWLRTPATALRGVIDVRRDARPPLTLRGPEWGLIGVR